ncbi:MAG: hypothetical protein ACK41C_12740 [Phenylobacterium sp.]|uniref:terminase small subunit-like protein n=1 Tax=Phenylobacterium sp. TaxID=1871053 RepID=UPI0039194AF7
MIKLVPTPPVRRRAPARFGAALAEAICERIAAGESWSRICETPGMPGYTTLYAWRRRHPEFAAQLAQAQEAAADRLMARAVEIAEEATKETLSEAKLKIEALRAMVQRLDRAAGEAPAGEAPARPVFNVKLLKLGEVDDAEAG